MCQWKCSKSPRVQMTIFMYVTIKLTCSVCIWIFLSMTTINLFFTFSMGVLMIHLSIFYLCMYWNLNFCTCICHRARILEKCNIFNAIPLSCSSRLFCRIFSPDFCAFFVQPYPCLFTLCKLRIFRLLQWHEVWWKGAWPFCFR